jgi:competence protein ComEA
MGVLFMLVGIALLLRSWWTPTVPPGLLVEVTGEVARPGWHVVDPPTLAAAVEAAGGRSSGLLNDPLSEGDLVIVSADGVRVAPSGDPLLVALPVDINRHGAAALEAIPGVSSQLAAAISASRAEEGLFYSTDDLARVDGISQARARRLADFVTVGEVPPRPEPQPVDVNRADAAQLEDLPGIGPSLAARIVAHRRAHGPFGELGDLASVSGVGPVTVERLTGLAVVGKP